MQWEAPLTKKILESETAFQGKVFDIRIDQVELKAGQSARVDLVVYAGSVTLVPIDPHGDLVLVRQYRHPIGEEIIEFPAGTLEPGEEPQACALRECQEEIGMRPGKLTALAEIYLAPGYSTERNHVFLATDLIPSSLPQDEDEEISLLTTSPEELGRLIKDGRVRDAKTIAVYHLAAANLDWGKP